MRKPFTNITFSGRKHDAIGIFYEITITIDGILPEDEFENSTAIDHIHASGHELGTCGMNYETFLLIERFPVSG